MSPIIGEREYEYERIVSENVNARINEIILNIFFILNNLHLTLLIIAYIYQNVKLLYIKKCGKIAVILSFMIWLIIYNLKYSINLLE